MSLAFSISVLAQNGPINSLTENEKKEGWRLLFNGKNLDEGNQTRIIVDGTHVQHYLNGVKVVDYYLWDNDWKSRKENGKWKDFPYYGMAKKGQIGLQDHGGLAQFRNIKIKVIK